MDEAEAKENRPQTPKTRGNKSNDIIVGASSGSTWGEKEREKFRINSSAEVDGVALIGEEWFVFSSMTGDQLWRNTCYYHGADVLQARRFFVGFLRSPPGKTC